jgi:ribosomal protein L11 methyltransferase
LSSGWPPSTRPDPDRSTPAAGLVEFELLVDAASAEALSDALLQAGALSVSLEDAEAGDDSERAIFGEPGCAPEALWRLNRLRALIGPDQAPEAMVLQAAGRLERTPPPIVAVRPIAEQDWVGTSRAQFEPLKIGSLWIVPSWSEPPDPAALNLRLDPGLAFGTGSHPSTRLCLQWLQAHVRPGVRVLDYGCGSGILAIAAGKLGAAQITGVDIDPLALQVARENSRLNSVQADYTAPGLLGDQALNGRFDVVIANILANPLIVLAPVLVAHLADAGDMVLAGVLARQVDALVGAYRAADPRLDLAVWASDGDWVCLAGRRNRS